MADPASQQQRTLMALRAMRMRIEEMERAQREPIAIVGIGCRFPGGASGPKKYWELLREGRDAVREIPSDRLALWKSIHPGVAQPGAVTSFRAGFLQEPIDRFDHKFFQISPREAASMDPQQRLLLEVSWEALEDAFIPPRLLFGQRGGVFVGIMTDDFTELELRVGERQGAYSFTGSTMSVAAGRLSYFYGLHGPAMSVDTACSSSLVALHLACQSLRNDDCDVALACGVNLILSPHVTMAMSRVGALSPDGRCWTFDARANGYVRGEGCGVIVLERLSDALTKGHHIRALVLGTAVNHDGRSSGLTAPNGTAQQHLLRQALASAALEPSAVGYLEAHGTGTPLGDPIELTAAASVLARDRAGAPPLFVGSAKTNIGHLDSAAGIAGVIKAALAVENGEIPPHLNFQRLNPGIVADGGSIEIPRELTPWPAGERRIAGVSAFGISGTNAHALVAEPEQRTNGERSDIQYRRPIPVLASGANAAAARAQLAAWDRVGDHEVGDACALAATGRAHFPYRIAVAASSHADTRQAIVSTLGGDRDRPDVFEGTSKIDPRVAFVFAGQGSQWAGMGRELLDDPIFRAEMDRCDDVVRRLSGWSVVELLERELPGAALTRTEIVQPVLTAFQIATSNLLISFGIRPFAVAGHSVGEIAAAHVAGVLSVEHAMELAVVRGRMMQSATGKGRMVSLEVDGATAERLAQKYDVDLAAANAPATTVLAGAPDRIEALVRDIEADGRTAKPLPVDYAFHSRQMDSIVAELRRALGWLQPGASQVAFVSTVSAAEEQGERFDASYWATQVRAPVRFVDATRHLVGKGADVLVEISPHPVLGPAMSETVRSDRARVAVERTFRRNEAASLSLARLVAALHVLGVEIDFATYGGARPRRVGIPGYIWQRERVWPPPLRAPSERLAGDAHPLLGRRLDLSVAPETTIWEAHVDVEEVESLRGHDVGGSPWMPAAAWLEAAFAAAERSGRDGMLELCDIELTAPLVLDRPVVVQTVLAGDQVTFASRAPGGSTWTQHARACVRTSVRSDRPALDLSGIAERCTEGWSTDDFYRRASEHGLVYGGRYRRLDRIRRRAGEALAVIMPIEEPMPFEPALLDAILQAADACLDDTAHTETALVPIGIERLTVLGAIREAVWTHARAEKRGDVWTVDVVAGREDGSAVVVVGGMTVRRVDVRRREGRAPDLYEIRWEELPSATLEAEPGGRWLVVDPAARLGKRIARGLTEAGNDVRVVEDAGAVEGSVKELAPSARGIVVVHDGDWEKALSTSFLVARTLVQLEADRVARIVFVTSGARRVVDADFPAARGSGHAGAWGLAATLALEHPRTRPRVIDADEPSAALVAAILGTRTEARTAVRQGRLYGERLVAASSARSGAPIAFSSAATYLVTGGLGGLGRRVVDWLVRRGASHVAVMSRSATSEAAQAFARDLERAGAKLVTFRGDVGRREDVQRVLDEIDRTMPKLRGVIHAAGVLADGTLPTLDARRIEEVVGPKARGAMHLDELTRGRDLDLFILFSSIAGVLGGMGQANYAAANAVLDAVAVSRFAAGLPALSVAWGRWAGAGMAADEATSESLDARGIRAIDPTPAFDTLEALVGLGSATATAAAIDWSRWRRAHSDVGHSPFFAQLPGASVRPKRRPIDELEELPPDQHASWMNAYVARTAAEILRTSDLEPQRPLGEYGFDSMMMMSLRTRIEGDLGLPVSTAQLYAHGSVARVAAHLNAMLSAKGPTRAPTPAADIEGELSRELELLRRRGFES